MLIKTILKKFPVLIKDKSLRSLLLIEIGKKCLFQMTMKSEKTKYTLPKCKHDDSRAIAFEILTLLFEVLDDNNARLLKYLSVQMQHGFWRTNIVKHWQMEPVVAEKSEYSRCLSSEPRSARQRWGSRGLVFRLRGRRLGRGFLGGLLYWLGPLRDGHCCV